MGHPSCAFALALLLLVPGATPRDARADEAPAPTECRDLCPLGWPDANPCVVRQNVTVVPDSTIDCSDHDVEVTGGNLVVHDGKFALKARSILVAHRTIASDCPGDGRSLGFSLGTTGDVTVGPGGALRASCSKSGGRVNVSAGGAIAIGGRGIAVNGTGLNGSAGVIDVRALGPVTTTAPIRAAIRNGFAAGGGIVIEGSTITIGNYVTAVGSTSVGQAILLNAAGDVTIVDRRASLNVRGLNSDGGFVEIDTDGTIRCGRPIRAQGTSGIATGGAVFMTGGQIFVTHDINVGGGGGGGQISLQAAGPLDVATGARRPVRLNATTGNGGFGGEIDLGSDGDDVTLGTLARLDAGNRGGAGGGGLIFFDAVGVSTAAGSVVVADGTPDGAGEIDVIARGPVSLLGTFHAKDGETVLDYRCTEDPCEAPPLLGPGVTGDIENIPDPDLVAPCGDGIRRLASEACDGLDLAGTTCTTLGYTGGTLACSAQCGFDASACF